MIGRTLNHFKITAHLGEGGMGTVYRAEDTRLRRDVAIKLLPEGFSQDPERLARFEREAQTVANLNHPNICALYDVGNTTTEDGASLHFLVMELVEGADLSERISRGPIPFSEASRIAKQIAAALESAHEHGIVHRDLKPANVKLTADGQVKVLDFGLAKARDGGSDSGSVSLARSPTITAQMTQAGTIMGTAGYMSPEQAKGLEADHRSDVWSFGVVLWEMLTGRRLFEGDSVSETLAAVLRDSVDFDSLPGDTPPTLRALLARCLDRDTSSRLRDIGEARIALEAPGSDSASITLLGGGSLAHVSGTGKAPSKRPWIAWSVAALFAAAAVVFFVHWQVELGTEQPPFHSSLITPPEIRVAAERGLAVSPDGLQVAFVGIEGGTVSRLWVQRLSESAPRPLPGTEGAGMPFWSPDSRNIGFFANRNLMRIAASGGPPQTLVSVVDARGGSWSEDGTIVYAPDFRDALHKIAASGGESTPLTRLDKERGETNHRHPYFLPGGKRLLFLAQTAEAGSSRDDSTIEIIDLNGGDTTTVVRANSSMAYSPTGHLLFWRNGTLLAQPLDRDSGLTSGDAIPVAENVGLTANEYATFSISRSGLMALQEGSGVGSPSRLIRLGRSGEIIGRASAPGHYRDIVLSHNGSRAAYRSDNSIWLHDLNRGVSTRLTFDDGDHYKPLFSPDDAWIVYGTNRSHSHESYRRSASGMGEEELIFTQDEVTLVTDWSPDGRFLLMSRADQETKNDLTLFELETGEIRVVIASPFSEDGARFSPDGRWVSYHTFESGGWQVYVVPVSGVGAKYQASTKSGVHAVWNPAGGELFYFSTQRELMAVEVVAEGDGLVFGTSRALFTIEHPLNEQAPFDVAADGKSFLVNPLDEQFMETHVTLIQNWTRLLRR